MTLVRRLLNWLAVESTQELEAEEENLLFDREQVDEKYVELLKKTRATIKTANAFVVAAELLVKDVQGRGRQNAKSSRRTKKTL